MDYEKIESARLLTASEYTLNSKLGYISLKQTLQPDEVLAVAFEYTFGGKNYQVGEFSSDIKETGQSLFVKLLKNTSNSPDAACWDLMMKNVYSLNAYSVQKEKFQLHPGRQDCQNPSVACHESRPPEQPEPDRCRRILRFCRRVYSHGIRRAYLLSRRRAFRQSFAKGHRK